jgi:hypothetical protein
MDQSNKASSSIRNFSIHQLEEELKRRASQKPDRMACANWTQVIDYVGWAITQIHEDKGIPKDFEHHLMEEVLTAMYSQDVWTWWNKKINGG